MKFKLEENVNIMISARHVHLTQDAIKVLFDDGLHVRNMLNQVGQFAAEETVSVYTSRGRFDNVRVIGPGRSYNQVELSQYDARVLGLDLPVRRSGDLSDAGEVTIETTKGKIKGNFAIIADRHVHFSPEDALKYGVVDGEELYLEIIGEKAGVVLANAKVSDDGYFEAHLDTDDANAFLIKSGDIGVIRK